jgi:hypothetical protein
MRAGQQTRLIDALEPRELGSSDAPLSFTRPVPGQEGGPGTRHLRLDGDDAFELSFWCGTCPLLFKRLYGSNRTMSIEELQDTLNAGTTAIDEATLEVLSAVIPDGTYVPMLLRIHPRLVGPHDPGDYFAHDQVEHRGVDSFWGLPEYPATQYYRAGRWSLSQTETLYEFAVPMVPPAYNELARVDLHADAMRRGTIPTAVSLSILDRTQPHDSFYAHLGLMHFILDGHHKLQAAAKSGKPLHLLALLSLRDSLSDDAEIARVREALAA